MTTGASCPMISHEEDRDEAGPMGRNMSKPGKISGFGRFQTENPIKMAGLGVHFRTPNMGVS